MGVVSIVSSSSDNKPLENNMICHVGVLMTLLVSYISLCEHKFMLPWIRSGYSGVDIAVIRENTEGEFSGIEHEVSIIDQTNFMKMGYF